MIRAENLHPPKEKAEYEKDAEPGSRIHCAACYHTTKYEDRQGTQSSPKTQVCWRRDIPTIFVLCSGFDRPLYFNSRFKTSARRAPASEMRLLASRKAAVSYSEAGAIVKGPLPGPMGARYTSIRAASKLS